MFHKQNLEKVNHNLRGEIVNLFAPVEANFWVKNEGGFVWGNFGHHWYWAKIKGGRFKKVKKTKKKLQNGAFYCVFFVKIAQCFQNRTKIPLMRRGGCEKEEGTEWFLTKC